jgi:adenylate cyclase
MANRISYSKGAKRFTAKHPFLSYVAIQANFWILANILLLLIVYLSIMAVAHYLHIPVSGAFGKFILLSVVLGALYGFLQGAADYYSEKKLTAKGSLGRYLVFKLMLSTVFSVVFFGINWYLISNGLVPLSFFNTSLSQNSVSVQYLFIVYFIFNLIMNVLLIFINQVNKKYGPGVILPLLLGKYSSPIEENRIFLFMDLQSSTALAESMGHILYSNFIRDSFLDINRLLSLYNAEVYQYVGDEIVLSWQMEHSEEDNACISFFFACEERFIQKSHYYHEKYGAVPSFKAGLHAGMVTAVEIGDVKRDIAYHGDILNTAARIQSLCNHYGQKLLASAMFINTLPVNSGYLATELGSVVLKGKSVPTEIVSITVIPDRP